MNDKKLNAFVSGELSIKHNQPTRCSWFLVSFVMVGAECLVVLSGDIVKQAVSEGTFHADLFRN